VDSASKAFNPSVNAWANAVPEGLQVSYCEGGGIPGIAGLNDDCFGVQVEFCGGDDFADCFEESIVIFCIGE
jgi:hypothetical protein